MTNITSPAVTCLLAGRQASFRGHELYSGLLMELGNLHNNAKGNAQQEQLGGRIPMCYAGADPFVVVLKFL